MTVAPNTTLIALASLAVVVGGTWLAFSELVLIYMEWYSGVEYEPPLRTIDRFFRWLRVLILVIAVAIAALNYLLPSVGVLFSTILRPTR